MLVRASSSATKDVTHETGGLTEIVSVTAEATPLQTDVAVAARKARAATNGDPDAALAQVAVTGPAAQAITLVGALKPSVVLISGCMDNQTSMDGEHNGAFTERLLKVWNHGAFAGSYKSFHARIRAAMPASQSPNLFALGPAAAFLAQPPFSV